jgi:hypothetical protein
VALSLAWLVTDVRSIHFVDRATAGSPAGRAGECGRLEFGLRRSRQDPAAS